MVASKDLLMVYDISTTSVTDLARQKYLINLLIDNPKVKGVDTVKDAIKHIDEMYNIAKGFAGKIKEKKRKENGEKNKAIQPPTVDHEPCRECGSTQFFQTGVCFTCSNCASSTSCS